MDLISIRRMKTKVYPYQAFDVFVMLEMEVILNGGWNADGMGLGKAGNLIRSHCSTADADNDCSPFKC